MLDHQIYIPTVSELNDPADGRPKLAEMTEEEMLTFLRAKNPTLTGAAQSKVSRIIGHNIRFHGVDAIRRRASEMLNEHTTRYRILSLSKRWNNLSLWAKYADNHTGYCLEFANVGRFFEHAVEVVYIDAIPMDVNNREHRTGYFFYCKTPDWSNEEEVRLIGLPASSPLLKIEPCWLTRIILGKDMSGDDRKKIQVWAQARVPQLTVVQAYFDDLYHELRLRE